MAKISVVINTLNEEKNLPRAIKSVKDFAAEIIVVDMKSDDATQAAAMKLGAKVYQHERTNYVEPARNFAISKATGDWVLILDADERFNPRLAKKLKNIIKEKKADYVRIPRKNIVFSKWLKYSRWWPDYNIRFFKKGKVTWNEVIHSVPMTTGTGVDLLAKEKYALVHRHYQSIDQYLTRMMRYTAVQAEMKLKGGYQLDWQDFITKPSGEFISRYFLGKGYRDGLHGLVLALLQSFSELVLYIRLWEKSRYKKQDPKLREVVDTIKKVKRDLNYWLADVLYQEGGGLVNRVRRKIRL